MLVRLRRAAARLSAGLRLSMAAAVLLSHAALAQAPSAEVAYTHALVGEALLEDSTRSLRATALYAETAGIPTAEAAEAIRRAERTLARLRTDLQADELRPEVTSMDFADMRRRAVWAEAAVREATEELRAELAEHTGDRSRRRAFGPLSPLPRRPGAIVNQFAFVALAPTRTWGGWSAGPAAWDVLRALDLQALSPWFGWYCADGGTRDRAQDPALVRQMADRLEGFGLPMLVWLEPEYNIEHLWNEIGEEMYLHDAAGHWQRTTRINNTINIFHPRVREEMCSWLEQVARGHRGDGRILGYELVEEPALRFDASDPSSANHEPRYGGYSQAALAAFRARLRGKYTDIADLNHKWGTQYASFEEVRPPALLSRKEGAWEQSEVALLAEFQEFRAAEHAECFRQMVAALHRGNPGCPVIPQFTTPLFGDPLGGVDLFRVGEAGWDFITFHTDTAFPYIHSLARYMGKPIWNDEYIWSARAPREGTGELGLRARAAIALWRNLMWGARGLVLFNLDFPWKHPKDGGDWNNDLLNDALDDRAPRYAAAVFPQTLRKVPVFLAELSESEVVDEGLMVLEPTTSLYTAVPTGTVQWWARRVTAELSRAAYRPAFCPERYLAGGQEDLSQYRTLVVPVAGYIPEGVAERLSEWVMSGGTLVALGPFATHDAYGRLRPEGAPLAALPAGETRVMGAGRVVSVTFRGSADDIAAEVLRAVDEAVGPRAVWASDARLELMLRKLPRAGLVLVVLNTDAEERMQAQVHVRGRFRRATDVTVDGGMPLAPTCPGGVTELPVALDPGEARVFVLR